MIDISIVPMSNLPIIFKKNILYASKKKASFFLLILCILTNVGLSFLFSGEAQATSATGYVRTDRMGSNVASGGLVCLTPQGGGTATKVLIAFPGSGTQSTTSYGVNSTASNWTVATTAIPSGTTAWPGIGTATSVSGDIVTFPSTTLTNGTQYCFTFASASTLTTPTAATTNNTGQIITETSGNAPLDTINFALANVSSNNDQISVTASVSATFSFSLGANTAALGTLSTSTATSATGITATVSTNAQNGWTAWVKSANGSLKSTAVPSATITAGTYVNSTSNLIDLASTSGSNYILDVITGTNSPSIDAAYSGTATNGNSTSGGHIDTINEKIASQTAPANASTFTLDVRARASATQQALSDYTDTLTVTAAGQF